MSGERRSPGGEGSGSYVAIYELRLYFSAGAKTIGQGEDARELSADEYAGWSAQDASMIKSAVEREYGEGGYACDGAVVFPRRLYRLADETAAELPMELRE